MTLFFSSVSRITRYDRNTRNIALFMRVVVFQVIFATRNPRITWNIRTRSICRMFRLFRVLGDSSKIPLFLPDLADISRALALPLGGRLEAHFLALHQAHRTGRLALPIDPSVLLTNT